MTKKEAIERFQKLQDNMPDDGDPMIIHGESDDILINRLITLGDKEITEVYRKIRRHYGFSWYGSS